MTEINNLIRFLIVSLTLILVFLTGILRGQEIVFKGQIDNSKDKIMVVTNRAFSDEGDDFLAFESSLDANGTHYYLTAQVTDGDWVVEKDSSLASLMHSETNYSDWLIFIHGDGKSLIGAIERANEIQNLHKVNVLVYAWPSKDNDLNGIKNFKNSYKNVEVSAPVLANFLLDLSDLHASSNTLFEYDQLTLFMHSLGNYYLERVLKEGLVDGLNYPLFDNLIINAAAVEEKAHNEWVEKINFTSRIYINSNDDDLSLSGLRILTRLGRQLGESARPPYAQNAIYVSFTEAVGFPGSMGPSHSYYFASITEKSEKIKQYYTTIFHGNEALLFNTELFAFHPQKLTYTIKF